MQVTQNVFRRALVSLLPVASGALLLLPSPVQAASIAHVQSAGASNNAAGSTLTATFPSANAAGDLIVASISFDTSGGTTWTCADSLGNTYRTATSVNDTRHGQLLGICYAINSRPGANTVTLGFGGASHTFRKIAIHEYSGVDTVSPLDKIATRTATGTTSSGAITSTAVIPAQPGTLVFGTVMADSGTTTISAGQAGFTLRQSLGSDFASQDQVQSTAASVAATFTFGTARDYLAHVATFKPSSSPPPADVTPPSAMMAAPAAAATVAGTNVTVSATASDNVGVSGAQFLLDNAPLGTEDTSAPFSISWNSTTAANGNHALSVRVRDAAGNTATAPAVNVAVDNQAPAGTVLINGGAATTSSTAATLTLSASDALSPVTEMRFSNTGASFTVAEPYATTKAWTLSAGGGTKTIYVQFKDAAGNWSGSSTDTIVLDTGGTDTSPPSVPSGLAATVISPIRVDLVWNASSDNTGVTGYTVYRNNVALATTASPSFSDTGVNAGTYTYAVAAFDAAGNISSQSGTATVTTGSGAFAGPLRTNPVNHLFFTDDTGKAIYLTGSHTWSNFSDNGLTDPPPVFDYAGYLDMMEGFHQNYFRLWSSWEQAKWNAWTTSPYWFETNPFARTGPGTAPDGKPKFDLTKFNQAYFDRLRQRVIEAGQRKIYVAVMLFNGWSVAPLANAGFPWQGHPMNSAYNINGINGDPNGNAWGDEVHTLQLPAVTAIQEAFVRRVIDTVNDLDNVTYEICNECDPNSVGWQYHMIDFIKAYEAGLPRQHPVGMSDYPGGGGVQDLLASPADWIAPGNRVSSPNKVVMDDTDHFCGVCQDRVWVWKEFLQGANVMIMDGYGSDDYAAKGHPGVNFYSPAWTNTRQNLGYIHDYADRVNLNFMTVKGSPMFSTGYGMANASASNGEYLGYLPSGGSITINLSATPGSLSVEWLNPATGAITQGAATTGGASRTLTAPFSGDAVVYVRNVVADSTRPSAPANLVGSGGLGAASLSWSAATDNVGVSWYNIHRAVTSGFTPSASNKAGQTPGLTYTDNVAAGTYYYVVTAQDAAGNVSLPSNEGSATVTTDSQPPTVPGGLQSSNLSDTSVTLSWSSSVDNVGVAGYRIIRNGVVINTTSQTSYSDSGLSPATGYSYTIASYDSSNNVSSPSAPLAITTTAAVQRAAFVQLKEAKVNATSQTLSTGAFTSAVTNGNLIVVWLWYNSGTQSVSSVTDSKGNTYVKAVGPTTGTAGMASWRQEIWYAANVAGGAGVAVTATFGGSFSAEKAIAAHEYSGLDRVSPLAQVLSSVSSSSNASSDSVAVAANSLIFGAALFQASGTAGVGYTQRSALASNVSEDRVVSASGPYSVAFLNSAQSTIIQMVVFK